MSNGKVSMKEDNPQESFRNRLLPAFVAVACVIAAAAFTVAVILARPYPRFAGLFYLGATAVGLSRVLLQRHYPSDVLAGAALGLMVGLVACILAAEIRGRQPSSRRRPVVAAVLLILLVVYGGPRRIAPDTCLPWARLRWVLSAPSGSVRGCGPA